MTRAFLPVLSAFLVHGAAVANDAVGSECVDNDVGGTSAWDVNAPHGPVHTAHLSLDEGTWMNVTVHEDPEAPGGGTVVFDLLGDLWAVPLAGGEATRLTRGPAWDRQPAFSPDGRTIAYVSDADGNQQVWLVDADGGHPRRLTDEDEARLTHPAWDPSGEWLVVRRRTVDTRSIGVTELWEVHLDGGKGVRLTSLDQHPHAGEPFVTRDAVWFSTRHGRFAYDGDPVAGLWDVARLDRATGAIRTVVTGPGGAARPMPTPDGRGLVFVSRDRTRTLLERMDLETGRRAVVADWLDHDQMEGFALEGVYPEMAWIGPDDDPELVLWARGRLWRVGLDGRRAEIPFHVEGDWTFHDVPRPARRVPDEVEARVIRWPRENPRDGRIAFSALGVLWVRHPDGRVERISPGTGYAPAWSPDGRTLAWTSWTDCPADAPLDADCGGRLHLTRGGRDRVLPVRGQLVNPAWTPDGRGLVVLRVRAGTVSPDLASGVGGEILYVDARTGASRVVAHTAGDAASANRRAPRLFVHAGRDGEPRLWWSEPRPVEGRKPPETVLVSARLDGVDLDRRVRMVFPGAVEVVPSPDFRRVAVKQDHQVHVLALPPWGDEVRTGPADPRVPERVLTDVTGDWIDWSPDGARLTWMEGPVRHAWTVDGLAADAGLPETGTLPIALRLPRARPEGTLALVHARALTMEGDAVVEDATIVIERDRIVRVEPGGAVPEGARVVDLAGRTVIPGLVDVHAHLHYGAGDVLPEQPWRYLVNLDYGVTTVFDPSASTDLVFTQAERVAAGLARGPRVFSTGFVLYGALSNQGAKTPDLDAARRHVRRLAGQGAIAVKVYQQGRRDQRQWYVQACREAGVLCVAEGGGDLGMDLGMVADGMTSVEHALGVAPLYADVRAFFAASRTGAAPGTAWVPTLLVAYGGLMGENWYHQHANPLDDPRLLRHAPRRLLDARLWRPAPMARDGDWNHQEVARQAARMARDGVLVGLGAHGQLQGLGVHWELWALGGPGAMTPMEALRAATIQGARHLGLDADLGSIAPGKLADLVILDGDPLQDLHATERIVAVIKNGEVVSGELPGGQAAPAKPPGTVLPRL